EMTVAVGYRDYPVYSGEKLVAIVTLFKENGKIYSSPIFGADWFDSFDRALRQYDGEDLTMIYGDDNERIVGPNGMIFIPSALLGNG
ncbi:MAG: hypothetical protein IJS94_00200, partial [Clostridia bacterium]|nr:hypothetical protein [Clostridia bacterium]